MTNNPLLNEHDDGEVLPNFDAIQPEHIVPALKQRLDEARTLNPKMTALSLPCPFPVNARLPKSSHRIFVTCLSILVDFNPSQKSTAAFMGPTV